MAYIYTIFFEKQISWCGLYPGSLNSPETMVVIKFQWWYPYFIYFQFSFVYWVISYQWKLNTSLSSLALAYLPKLHSLLFLPPLLPLIPPQWSFPDILCHSPDTALPQSLLSFSLLPPWSSDRLFWTMFILVWIAPLLRESQSCL